MFVSLFWNCCAFCLADYIFFHCYNHHSPQFNHRHCPVLWIKLVPFQAPQASTIFLSISHFKSTFIVLYWLLITQKTYGKMEKIYKQKLKELNVFLTSRRGCACIFLQDANTSLRVLDYLTWTYARPLKSTCWIGDFADLVWAPTALSSAIAIDHGERHSGSWLT